MPGRVFICGAGPGDPHLLTLKAAKLLKTCDIVLYDRLVTNKIIERIPDRCKKIYVGRGIGAPLVINIKQTTLWWSMQKKVKKFCV